MQLTDLQHIEQLTTTDNNDRTTACHAVGRGFESRPNRQQQNQTSNSQRVRGFLFAQVKHR